MYILRIKPIISRPTMYISIISFILIIILSFTIPKISFIYKYNSKFRSNCKIDESKNRLGPGKCYFKKECKGDRYCSSNGICIGKSNC